MNKFLKNMTSGANLPRFIISSFFLLVCIMAVIVKIPFTTLMSDTLVRFAMNGVLVLAMVPSIQSGLGPNFALPIGIIAGLVGSVVSFEVGLPGFGGLWLAIAISVPLAMILGYLYGQMLNKVKGSELIVSTYTGFSIVSLMSIGWILLPLKHPEMTWPLGKGLRNIILLDNSFGKMLNDLLSLKYVRVAETGNLVTFFNRTDRYITDLYPNNAAVVEFTIPTGLLIFFFLCCFLVYLFNRSKIGMEMRAAGDNPKFALASGINVDQMRILGATISTVIASIGIVVFSQSYGYLQLYQAPLFMAFPAIAAILIGGASTQKAKIFHVIIGTFLFQGLLTMSLPVANKLIVEGNLSEVLRMIIQNGVILYALTKVGGQE